jgi:hypothetical protein
LSRDDRIELWAEGQREIRAAERQRNVRAHTRQQAQDQAHQAIDRGYATVDLGPDEFASLFNPMSKDGPLGPDDDDPNSPTGPGGHYQLPNPQPSQQSASAYAPYSDAELFASLYPPGTTFEDEE